MSTDQGNGACAMVDNPICFAVECVREFCAVKTSEREREIEDMVVGEGVD